MQNIFEEAEAILTAKGNDYGDLRKMEEEYGNTFYHIQIDNKVRRLKKLTSGKTSSPKFESINDTLIDLINYAVLFHRMLNTGVASSNNVKEDEEKIFKFDVEK